MKLYETSRLLLEPLLPPLYRQVRQKLQRLVNFRDGRLAILDVGGRKSPYTIGLHAQITVIDLPRESELQQKLNLGVDDTIVNQIRQRRSNIERVIFGDMTCSDLPDKTFDLVVSVEVLEHVEKDELFVSEVFRVLKPGGIFLMTTPNGDWVINRNPDHKRHYKRTELKQLLEKHFADVSIDYAVAGGRCRKMGLKSWSLKNPPAIALSMFGNVVNSIQSSGDEIKCRAKGTHHLIAVAKKKKID
jgi:SAM-dependent methyltransferase